MSWNQFEIVHFWGIDYLSVLALMDAPNAPEAWLAARPQSDRQQKFYLSSDYRSSIASVWAFRATHYHPDCRRG